jgi:alpha-ribazole phosphatase
MTSKTTIYLVRHGEVAGSEVFKYNGQLDVPLTQKGMAQYGALADRLKEQPFSACYSSDLTRCKQGAALLCNRLGIEPVIVHELRELSFGRWEGTALSELMERYPEEWAARMADFVNYRVPEGESLADLHDRVVPVLEKIIRRHEEEGVLVVAHGGVNRIILLHAMGAPLTSIMRIEQSFGCLNIIDCYSDGTSVVRLLNG